MDVMSQVQHLWEKIGRTCFRCLMCACIALSTATLWDVAHEAHSVTGLSQDWTTGSGIALLAVSIISFRWFGRLAVYGFAIAVWTLFTCLLPTI